MSSNLCQNLVEFTIYNDIVSRMEPRKRYKYREDWEDVEESYPFLPHKIKLHITVSNVWPLYFRFLLASLIRDFVAAQTSSGHLFQSYGHGSEI